jgi:ribose 5-phosphate isomerase RpiB
MLTTCWLNSRMLIPPVKSVANGNVDRGIAFCASVVCALVCANKVPSIRARLVPDHFLPGRVERVKSRQVIDVTAQVWVAGVISRYREFIG